MKSRIFEILPDEKARLLTLETLSEIAGGQRVHFPNYSLFCKKKGIPVSKSFLIIGREHFEIF